MTKEEAEQFASQILATYGNPAYGLSAMRNQLTHALEDWQRAKPQVERWEQEHPYDAVEVECIDHAAGIYRIHSSYDKGTIVVTRRGLFALLAWLTEHQEDI